MSDQKDGSVYTYIDPTLIKKKRLYPKREKILKLCEGCGAEFLTGHSKSKWCERCKCKKKWSRLGLNSYINDRIDKKTELTLKSPVINCSGQGEKFKQ